MVRACKQWEVGNIIRGVVSVFERHSHFHLMQYYAGTQFCVFWTQLGDLAEDLFASAATHSCASIARIITLAKMRRKRRSGCINRPVSLGQKF